MPKRSRYNVFGTLQGTFNPSAVNSSGEPKYQGKHAPIYRSSYERQCFHLLEKHPGIIWWKSEATVIPYMSVIDGKKHSYYMDLTFEAIDKETGLPQVFLVEVKPDAQTIPPVKTTKQRQTTFVTACKRYGVNISKWNAAYEYAKKRGYKFFIWTEQRMFEYQPRDLT